MKGEDIDHIQMSWGRLLGKEEAVVSRFYDLLFLQNPGYKPMFSQSGETQHLKFITMLNLIVNGLDHLSLLEDHLINLGKKHRHLNIDLDDYETVSKTVVQAVNDVSVEALSSQEKNAWLAGLMLVSNIMYSAQKYG